MITKVIDQQSVTFWFYKLNITYSINKDSSNHFLSIERLLDALRTTIPTVHITHQKSGCVLTQRILSSATSILDICNCMTGIKSPMRTTLNLYLQSTDQGKRNLFDPLGELRVPQPNYLTSHVDSFRDKPACMLGIIANIPCRNVNWNKIKGVLWAEMEQDTVGRTTIKVKPTVLDFQMRDGTKRTKANAIFGTRADAAIARGKMLKLCYDQIRRNECDLEEGIFVSTNELHRKGKTRNLVLSTHGDYVTNHITIELRKLELCDLEEPASKELHQSKLTNTFNDYNTDITKLDLLKCFIMKEQQSKATNIT